MIKNNYNKNNNKDLKLNKKIMIDMKKVKNFIENAFGEMKEIRKTKLMERYLFWRQKAKEMKMTGDQAFEGLYSRLKEYEEFKKNMEEIGGLKEAERRIRAMEDTIIKFKAILDYFKIKQGEKL